MLFNLGQFSFAYSVEFVGSTSFGRKPFDRLTLSGNIWPGNTKGGSITVLLTSCLSGLDWSVLQIKTKIVSFHGADSKPVKQDVNGTVELPPLLLPDLANKMFV
jgi:hypothetical protein